MTYETPHTPDKEARLHPGRTYQEVVDKLAQDYVARAYDEDEPMTRADTYGQAHLHAELHVMAMNGPTEYLTFIFNTDGSQVDYAVVEYNEGWGKAYSVIPSPMAGHIHDALRRD